VGVLEHSWAEQLPVRIAAEVSVEPGEVLERVRARRLDRSSQHAVIAATEAWVDSGLADAPPDPERVGVAMASGIGGVTTLLSNYDALLEKGPRRVSPLAIPMLMPNGPAASVGLMVDAKAGVHTPVSACASGNEAIALGIDMIRLGRADVVVVGGTEAAVHPLPMAAFANMMALSKRNDAPTAASRPWDLGRDGFVLGEVPASSSWSHRSMQPPAALGYTPSQRGPASPPTRTTSRNPTQPARGLREPSGEHWARPTSPPPTSGTSTHMPRPRRWVMWPRRLLFGQHSDRPPTTSWSPRPSR